MVGKKYNTLFFQLNMYQTRTIYIIQGFIILMALILLNGCQEEIPEVTIIDDETVVTNDSELLSLVRRITLKDGSKDNIIDRASCLTLNYPFQGTLNSNTLTFNAIEDITTLGDQAALVELQYPVTVTLPDHSEQTLTSESELNTLRNQCVEGGADEDIECVDFIYPFDVSIFNTISEVASVETINDDQELFMMVDNLGEDVFSFEFPVTLTDFQGNNSTNQSNDDLQNLIESLQSSCDEMDIIDFEVDTVLNYLAELLLVTDWVVTNFEDVSNQTSLFEDHFIRFEVDSLLIGGNQSEQVEGEWAIEREDDLLILELDLDAEEAPLILLNDCWEVTGYNENIIQMSAPSDTDGFTKTLEIVPE